MTHPAAPGRRPVGSPGTPVRRSVVVGDALYTVSAAGVKASSLASFADLGFARLPQNEPAHAGALALTGRLSVKQA